MSQYKKLGKDIFLMTIGSFGSKLLSFIFVPFYTATLTTEEYGTSDLVTTTITLLFPFFSLIICEAMMRFALEKTNDPAQIWKIGIKVTFLGSAVFLCLSPLLFLTPMADFFVYVVVYYLTYSLNQALTYFVRGLNKVKIFALNGIIQTAVVVITSIIFLLVFKIGIHGYLLSQIIGSVVSTVFMFFSTKIYRFGFSFKSIDKNLQLDMLKYSIPMIPNSASWWIANASSRFFLTAFISASATGIFSVAYKIPNILSTLTGIFGKAWKLSAVDEFGSETSKRFFEDIFSKLTTLMLIAISVLMLVNKPLASILFSNDFYQAWQFVPLLLLSSVMHAYSEFFGTIYTSSYKTRFLVISTAIGAVINVAFNLILIPICGIFGSAIAAFLGQAAIYICRAIHSRRIITFKINWKRNILCYVLIFFQVIITSGDYSFEYIYSFGIIFLLLLLLHKDIQGLITMFLGLLKRKQK